MSTFISGTGSSPNGGADQTTQKDRLEHMLQAMRSNPNREKKFVESQRRREIASTPNTVENPTGRIIQDGFLRLNQLSTNPKNLANLQGWINKEGVTPEKKFTELMKGNAVVIIGHDIKGADYIAALHKGGATHFAIQLDPGWQAGLDKFMGTGDPKTLPNFIKNDTTGYLAMVQKARELNIKLVAVDDKNIFDPNDDGIAKGITQLFKGNPDAKVVFSAAKGRVAKGVHLDGRPHDASSIPDDIKKDKAINAKGVVSVIAVSDPTNAPWLTDINETVMVPSKGSPYYNLELENSPQMTTQPEESQFGDSFGKSADYQIFYRAPKPKETAALQ